MRSTNDWPYPFWIAHRGAGTIAPENTLAAFRLGQTLGWDMAECDVTLSADGIPFLLHDASLERTTDGHGWALRQDWAALAALDAGRWHSPVYAGERLLSLADLAMHARSTGLLLNLELKPGPGDAQRTGCLVATEAARLWQDAPTPPLISSFERTSLQTARDAAPALPRALLFDTLHAGWCEAAQALGCVAVVIEHTQLDEPVIATAHSAGLRILAFTVNTSVDADRLRRAGIDGLISDAVDRLGPATGAACTQPINCGNPR